MMNLKQSSDQNETDVLQSSVCEGGSGRKGFTTFGDHPKMEFPKCDCKLTAAVSIVPDLQHFHIRN